MERLIVWHRWLPPPETTPEALAHAQALASRLEDQLVLEGASVLSRIGATVVLGMEGAFVREATEACLSLHETFERARQAERGQLSHALTIGTVDETRSGFARGEAIDRAQALANRARSGEVVLDAGAQAAAASTFLFAREVAASSAVRGEAIDRATPRRRACRQALRHLHAPALPASAQAQLRALRQIALSSGRHRVLLLGAYGAGTGSWLAQLARELKPPLWLHVSAIAAPLAPLASLAYALARLTRDKRGPETVLDPTREGDSEALEVLDYVRRGQAVVRRDVISALRHLLARTHEKTGRRAWITTAPAPLIDPATLAVLADTTREGSPEHLLVLRMDPETKPPQSVLRGGSLAEIRIPPLSQAEARAMAQSMLGRATPNDVARRAAAMGGDTPLGVAEAVRVLIASGDVIYDGEKFVWRRGPAGRLNTLSSEALLEERIDQQDATITRVLEVLSSVPDPNETSLVLRVAEADGLSNADVERAYDELSRQSLIDRVERAALLSPMVRTVVEAAMPPARLAEVNRFIATALEQRMRKDQGFARATLGYYLAHGGRQDEAVEALLEVARTAGQRGFLRSGVRLAAAAVECDPSPKTRQRAAQLAQAMNERARAKRRPAEAQSIPPAPSTSQALPVPEEPAPPLASEAVSRAIEAMIARDFDAVDRSIELMVAAGRDGPAVDRLRAMSMLSRGDRDGALRALERSRPSQPPKADDARVLLTQALVQLENDELEPGVRSALRALAFARRASDIPGERAALQTMALFYRRLGRHDDAQKLEVAASSVGTLPRATVSGS